MRRPWLLFGFELSYFTRKMEAALELHNADYRRRSKTILNWNRLERRSGTRKVPVVVGPDGVYRCDTTPTIDHFDELDPRRRLFPVGIDGVVVRLVEEWLDEWFPRSVLHYRWQHPDSRTAASAGLVREAAPWLPPLFRRRLERRIREWGGRACRAFGLEESSQQEATREDADLVWAGLERQLDSSRYALGDRPTAVDAVLLGALRGHYLADPAARRVLERFPRVRRWSEDADRWDGSGHPLPFPERTAFADVILERMAGAYRSWLLAHAEALQRGERVFTADMGGRAVRFRTLHRPDPVESRTYLMGLLRQQLTLDQRSKVQKWLADRGLADVFSMTGKLREAGRDR